MLLVLVPLDLAMNRRILRSGKASPIVTFAHFARVSLSPSGTMG
jgi:hypothetical protein